MNDIACIEFDIFLKSLMQQMRQMLGASFEIQHKLIDKNNGIKADCITLKGIQEDIAQSIRLDSYYEMYQKGEAIARIGEAIQDAFLENRSRYAGDDIMHDYRLIRDKVFFRLVNKEMNQSLLTKIPYMEVLDLCITFHCLVKEEKSGIGAVQITNDHCQGWEIEILDLWKDAIFNTARMFPPVLKTMDEVMRDILKNEIRICGQGCSEEDGIYEENENDEEYKITEEAMIDEMTNMMMQGQGCTSHVFVLTNQKGINGASCLLYPGIQQAIQKQLKGDFFILPSSIHEVILVPAFESEENLEAMVEEVNRTQVPAEDILSDHVYLYSKVKHVLNTFYLENGKK